MNKEKLEKFVYSITKKAVESEKIYNDFAPRNASYPYIVMNSSRLNNSYYPRVDGTLSFDIWDKQANYSSVNQIADKLQNSLDYVSFTDDDIVGTFFMDVRNNVEDEDKSLKRCRIDFEVNIYFRNEEE